MDQKYFNGEREPVSSTLDSGVAEGGENIEAERVIYFRLKNWYFRLGVEY